MNRSPAAIASLVAAAILVVVGVAPSMARPKPASGSNCSSSWVNNEAAMQCFIRGEEEARNGVRHPHYVACLAGTIFCCKDNDRGGQNCVAQERTSAPSSAVLIRAILAAQRRHLKTAERPAVKGGQRASTYVRLKQKSRR